MAAATGGGPSQARRIHTPGRPGCDAGIGAFLNAGSSRVAEPFAITALISPGRQNLPRVRALVDYLADHFD